MTDALANLAAWIDSVPSHLSPLSTAEGKSQVVERNDFPTFPTFPTFLEGSETAPDRAPCACGQGRACACERARTGLLGPKVGKVGNVENTNSYGWEESGKNPAKVGKVGNPEFVRTYDAEDLQALFDERAGIFEYLGGHDRSRAERLAREELSSIGERA